VSAGLDVEILTFDGFRRDLPRREERDGVVVHRLTERGFPIRGIPRFSAIGMGFSLARFLLANRRRVDVVHAHDFNELAAFAKLICGVLGIPCAALVTGVRTALEQGLGSRDSLRKLLWRALTRSGWCVAMSDWVAGEAVRHGVPRERIVKLPTGVEIPPEVERSPRANGEFLLVATSNLIPVKRIDLLVEAVGLLATKYPGLRLEVAGDGPERKRLEELALSVGASDRIEWLGRVGNVPELLRGADAFVHPSEGEGLSNSILEAMAYGLPVVARKAGFNEELIDEGRTGLLFEETAGSLAGAIARLIDDPALGRRLGAEGRRAVRERNAFEVVVAEYPAFLRTIGAGVSVPERGTEPLPAARSNRG
jgi:glycosyltransferase involved in cell wall biosynthesis